MSVGSPVLVNVPLKLADLLLVPAENVGLVLESLSVPDVRGQLEPASADPWAAIWDWTAAEAGPAGSQASPTASPAEVWALWSDVGSWAAVHRMLPQDENGNAGNGKWLSLGAKNSFVHAQERLVVLLGVTDTVVVDTPDALLVGDIKRSQEVRELVTELNNKGYGAYTVK